MHPAFELQAIHVDGPAQNLQGGVSRDQLCGSPSTGLTQARWDLISNFYAINISVYYLVERTYQYLYII